MPNSDRKTALRYGASQRHGPRRPAAHSPLARRGAQVLVITAAERRKPRRCRRQKYANKRGPSGGSH